MRSGCILQRVPRGRNILSVKSASTIRLVFASDWPTHFSPTRLPRPFYRDFVPDSAIPTKLLNFCAHTDEREFTHMLYSTVIGDRNNFKDTPRQVHHVEQRYSSR